MTAVPSPLRELSRRLLRIGRADPAAPRPVQPPGYPVDVVLPVYRGLPDTVRCVNSVLASPVRTPYRLVIVNDASPEPELTDWLRSRATEDPRVVLLENAHNLGFVKTVNRGMGLSDDHDVLILNSDTEVANDWLDRMRAAAYGDARVASVTPFSTNATICSYPRFCEDNAMPSGYSTAQMDALCARTHPGAVIDVPTGVGFCMYIRRDCLREIGLFDTDRFGRGYGEENDFCRRAAAAGWRNLHLLGAFVLHTGGVSFGSSRLALQEAGMQMLRRLHPNYDRDVRAYIKADPALPARLSLDIARFRESGRPVIVAVLHNRSGGTLRHAKELARRLEKQAIFLLLTPMHGKRVLLHIADEAESFRLAFRMPQQFDGLVAVLRRTGVQHVHFHHLLGHDPAIRELPGRLGVSHDFTVHDYYSYCTRISLTDKKDRYVGEQAPGQCRCCAPDSAAPRDGLGTVADWRRANARMLVGARRVFAPSQDAARRVAAFVPGARVLTVPHADMPPAAELPDPRCTSLPPQARLKIVVIGALSRIKGADVLEATALEAARRNAPMEFHLLGYGYRPLKTHPAVPLTVHGQYNEGDLVRLLAELRPDVAWFPAQWPETYSYTLSATLKAGLPVVVTNLGALAERVQGRAWSWINQWDASPADWVNHFSAIRERHFIPGVPPNLAESQAAACALGSAFRETVWSYEREYLAPLPAPPRFEETIAAEELEPFVPGTHQTPGLRLLAVLTYLRFHPLLRGLVFGIPAQWRQRVNDWLSA